MSEKRRGLGRGLGALIPTGLESRGSEGSRPVDVFFPDRMSENNGAGPNASDGARDGMDRSRAGSASVASNGTAGNALTSQDAGATRAVPGDGAAAGTGVAATNGQVSTDRAVPSNGAATSKSAALPNGAAGRVALDGRSTGEALAGQDDVPESPDDGLLPVPGVYFAELPVDSIRPNPKQPRTVFDEDALDELVGSIQEIGVLQPIVVRPLDDGYELIMGERRWRATQAAGLGTVPAIVRQTDDSDLLRDALLENLHRSQLNPLEEAAAYQQLLDDFGCTHDELATRIHRSRPQISNTLRLLRLPPLVQRRVAAGVLSAGHARALLGLSDGAAIERLAQRIVAEGLSVRSVEEVVALGGEGIAPRQQRHTRAGVRNEALDELATRLSDRFETRVKVDLGKSRGKLTVEFASVQDLNRILASLAPEDPGVFRG